MCKNRYRVISAGFFIIIFMTILACSLQRKWAFFYKTLVVSFSGKASQIEIGGPFAGVEMHGSSPLINRISFFYPFANSIDLSTDYWKRDQFRVMFLGLKIGNKPKEWIKPEPFEYYLTPYSVKFQKYDNEKSIEIRYDFCKNKPAMISRFKLINNSRRPLTFEFYTHLETSLRTSHTYKKKNKAWTSYQKKGSTIYTYFEGEESGNTQIFVSNAGIKPKTFSTNGKSIGFPGTGQNWWINTSSTLPGELIDQDNPGHPVSAYVYKEILMPSQNMSVVQIIGSCRIGEGKENVRYLLKNYQKEIDDYERHVLKKSYKESIFETGDTIVDHSVHWAKAVLTANAHYLDGEIVPMPCPAEYNFYFTHDVLLTDLAAVYFDIHRVRNDLKYIMRHADRNKIIPHAYYWKDNHYITEYADSDNWNHFWFVLLCASYLRHSGDKKTLESLYPYIIASIKKSLTHKKEDDLIWAHRPDWWDIGESYGPRSYMTILGIRAIREFIYISVVLDKKFSGELMNYEETALKMEKSLIDKLWDDDRKYLINYYEDGIKDNHIYIGSLLAVYFNLLDDNKKKMLIKTATKYLLDEKVGIFNVFPMDFHCLIDYLKFSGNEAGNPFVYANGGIWSHGNAWYVLGLTSAGKKEEAYRFLKNIMTVKGIKNSPNGQPAMYEYRNGNYKNPSIYGKVDKPQFLWAAGWYIYSVYHLIGVRENEWNTRFEPYLLKDQKTIQYTLIIKGNPVKIIQKGSGSCIEYIRYDGKSYPSVVIPDEMSIIKTIDIKIGEPEIPYLEFVNSVLVSSRYNHYKKSLVLILKAFSGHRNKIKIISPGKAKSIYINRTEPDECWISLMRNNVHQINFEFQQQSVCDTIVVIF